MLEQVDGWAPDAVAVGVTDADGTLATHGPTDRTFPFASVTKPLAAMGVLVSVRDGVIHLDEPAADPAPEGATVRHLLSHAAGLPPDPGGPVSTPGRLRIYSNWGYDLLGDLVEQRTGTPIAGHLDAEVFGRLGMAATRLEGSPAHGAHGTVDDLLRFARELLQPDVLLEPALLSEATSVQFAGIRGVVPGYGRHDPCDWGLGFELKDGKSPHWTAPRGSPRTFGHFGQSGSFLWVDPDAAIACAFLASEPFGSWARERWPSFNDAVLEAFA